jgi:hypothetical protein
MNDFLTISEASVFASGYLNKILEINVKIKS